MISVTPWSYRPCFSHRATPLQHLDQDARQIGVCLFRVLVAGVEPPNDPVFKEYRKEYKKCFAWIKAGRISDTDFYAWSEQARDMKKKCDREVITLEEFTDWLKNS